MSTYQISIFHSFIVSQENEFVEFCPILDSLDGVRIHEGREDYRTWTAVITKGFSCKSFFSSFFSNNQQPFIYFKTIWKTPVPKKIQFFWFQGGFLLMTGCKNFRISRCPQIGVVSANEILKHRITFSSSAHLLHLSGIKFSRS